MDSAAHAVDFLLSQGASASAKQHSVLVVHVFLLSWIGADNKCVKLAGDVSISVPGATGAEGDDVSVEISAANEFNFLRAQFSRSGASQYTLAVIHSVFLSCFGPVAGPKGL